MKRSYLSGWCMPAELELPVSRPRSAGGLSDNCCRTLPSHPSQSRTTPRGNPRLTRSDSQAETIVTAPMKHSLSQRLRRGNQDSTTAVAYAHNHGDGTLPKCRL